MRGAPWSPVDREAVQSPRLIAIEPALKRPRANADILSHLDMAALASCHQDSLTALTQAAISGRFEGGFELLTFGLVQGEHNHRCSLLYCCLGGYQTQSDKATCCLNRTIALHGRITMPSPPVRV